MKRGIGAGETTRTATGTVTVTATATVTGTASVIGTTATRRRVVPRSAQQYRAFSALQRVLWRSRMYDLFWMRETKNERRLCRRVSSLC